MQLTEQVATLETLYPPVIDFANEQLKIFWLPEEIKVEKDIQDILVNMTPAEKHGVITTLKLFSLYELKAGSEYWGSAFPNTFTRPEFQRMASVFNMFELAVHKPFYSKLNELLHLDSDEFYFSYRDSEVLSARMAHIEAITSNTDIPLMLAGFSLIEGAVLYSSFAFLKHFQSQGKNKLTNVVRGINFSVRDENIHSTAGAWTFKQYMKESNPSALEKERIHNQIITLVKTIREHEFQIIDMTFSEGDIEGITATQMKHFVESRLNLCMQQLGYPKLYEVDYNPIAKWFYEGINGFTFNDQFSGVGNSYHRQWDETAFLYADYNDRHNL